MSSAHKTWVQMASVINRNYQLSFHSLSNVVCIYVLGENSHFLLEQRGKSEKPRYDTENIFGE